MSQAGDSRMLVALLLWFFLGGLGAHQFYAGRAGRGLAYLFCFIVGWATLAIGVGAVLLIFLGIGMLVDLVRICSGTFFDDQREAAMHREREEEAPAPAGMWVIHLLVIAGIGVIVFGFVAAANPRAAALLQSASDYTAPHARRPQANPQAQAAAVARFPALAKAGSPLHSEFMARYNRLVVEDARYFDDSNWPLALATESQQALANAEAERRQAATAAAAEAKARRAAATELYFRVSQVFGNGAVVRPYRSYAIGDSLSRVGGGGHVGVGYELGDKLVFLAGLAGATEGQKTKVLAYRDGAETVNDGVVNRTLEKWVFVAPAE